MDERALKRAYKETITSAGVYEELWLERLAPYGERGYNARPK
jgi:hypothetical protein